MENVLSLNNVYELNEEEMLDVEGGLFPIVIAGITITKGAAVAGGIFGAGLVTGGIVGWLS